MIINNYQGALQQPIASTFNAKSTAADVVKGIDLTGKVAIVTGGGTGIGLETVRTLSKAGATVIVAARDLKKATKNLQGIDNIEIEALDLIDTDSVDLFAGKFLSSGRPLHILINNAGIMFVPLRRDAKGNESQLATNYLSVFRLTKNLWPALKKANGARVINVSSFGHQFAPFNFDDPNFTHHDYETLEGYGQSKTALNLFSLELDNRAKSFGVSVYSLHPGNIWGTELTREAPAAILQQFGFIDKNGDYVPKVIDSLKKVPEGAATTVWAATSSLLNDVGGVYLEDVNIATLSTDPSIPSGVKEYSLDEANAKRLWSLTEELTGLTFNVNKMSIGYQ